MSFTQLVGVIGVITLAILCLVRVILPRWSGHRELLFIVGLFLIITGLNRVANAYNIIDELTTEVISYYSSIIFALAALCVPLLRRRW